MMLCSLCMYLLQHNPNSAFQQQLEQCSKEVLNKNEWGVQHVQLLQHLIQEQIVLLCPLQIPQTESFNSAQTQFMLLHLPQSMQTNEPLNYQCMSMHSLE